MPENQSASKESLRDFSCIQKHRDDLEKCCGRFDSSQKADVISCHPERVKIGPHSEIECFVYEPHDLSEANTLFFIPGTASRAHAFEPTDVLSSQLCDILQCRVITIFHRLAPENQHPIPYDDVCHVLDRYLKYPHINEHPIAISGYSSGGLLALLVAIQTVRIKLPISQLLLIAPLVNLEAACNLIVREPADILPPEFFSTLVNLYLPEGIKPTSPEISPFHNELELLQKLPPIKIVVGENDILYPSILDFSNKLEKPDMVLSLPGENHSLAWKRYDYLHSVKEEFWNNFTRGIAPGDFCPVLQNFPGRDSKRIGVTPSFNFARYVHREDIQNALQEKLSEQSGDGSRVVNCYGRSGSGKTQLALYYYYYLTDRYDKIFWFNAKNDDILQRQYFQFAEDYNLFQGSTTDKIEKIARWLESQDNIFLVYDNAISVEELDRYLPKKRAHALITSEEQIIFGHAILVPKMNLVESRKIITHTFEALRYKMNISDGDINCLTDILRLPLSLQQICTYMEKEKLENIRSYMEIYNKIVTENSLNASPEEMCVWLNIEKSFSPSIIAVFQCFVLLGGNNIPMDLFSEEEIIDIKKLRKYRILSINEASNDFSIHSVFQNLLKKMIEISGNNIKVSNDTLTRIIEYTKKLTKEYLPAVHVQSIFRYLSDQGLLEKVDQKKLCYFYCTLSIVRSAFLNKTKSEILEALGSAKYLRQPLSDDPFLEYEYLLAETHFYWEMGELAKGLEAVDKLVDLCEKHLKEFEEMPFKLASCMHNCGAYYNSVGRIKKAEGMFEKALAVLPRESKIKEIESQKAKTYSMLGFILYQQGKYNKAVEKIESAVCCLERVKIIPSSHPLVSECRGAVYLGVDREKALTYLGQSLATRALKYGNKHRLVAQTKMRMGLAQNTIEDAVEYFKECMDIFFSLYKEDNNQYLSEFYFLIGKFLLSFNKLDVGRLFLFASLQAEKKFLPDDDFYKNHWMVQAIQEILEKSGIAQENIDQKIMENFGELNTQDCREKLRNLLLFCIPSKLEKLDQEIDDIHKKINELQEQLKEKEKEKILLSPDSLQDDVSDEWMIVPTQNLHRMFGSTRSRLMNDLELKKIAEYSRQNSNLY